MVKIQVKTFFTLIIIFNWSGSAKSEFQGDNLAFRVAKEDDRNKYVFEPKAGHLNYMKKAAKQSGEKDGKDSGEDCLQDKDQKMS